MGQQQFHNLSAYYRAVPGMHRLSEFQEKLTRLLSSGEALLAFNKDAGFSLLIHLRKLGTECCRQIVFLVSALAVHLESSL